MNLDENPLYYISKNRERGEGISEGNGYTIISGDGSKSSLTLVKELDLPEGSSIITFKNNKEIEEIAQEKKLQLLNPSATLAETIENKITQTTWLGELASLLPPFTLQKAKDIQWNKELFILQWGHGHTGESTYLIQQEKDLTQLKEKFPEREARISTFIKGPVFTQNIVVAQNGIYFGNISYQITGILPFSENPFSTIGNDWSLPPTLLSETQLQQIETTGKQIGDHMKNAGWKGLFGIDVIYDDERDQFYLLEINARQAASTTFESQLQQKLRDGGVKGITIFEAHILALLGKEISEPIIPINDGSQIIQRVTSIVKKIDTENLKRMGFLVTEYSNVKLNSDLVRIQSEKGIMETHNKFNSRGKEILKCIE